MSTNPGGRPRAATIYLAECRDRMLDALRRGDTRVHAAESIGCTWSTARRYLRDHPEFAEKCRAAAAGEDVQPEATGGRATAPLARVVLDAEPIDGAPCDADAPWKPRELAELETFRGDLMTSIANVVADDKHPAFPRIADLLFKAYYGAPLLRQMRAAEAEVNRPAAPPTISEGRARVLEAVTRARQSE